MPTIFKNFWRRHLDSWVALALWIASILLAIATGGATGSALRATLTTGTAWVTSPLLWIPRTIALWPDNARLREELMKANAENSFLREAMAENDRLRTMLNFSPPTGWLFKNAQVIARYRRIGNRRIVINLGKSNGIESPMPVMTTTGLVGRVLSARMFSSEVEIIGDPQMGVAVRNRRSRVEGILRADHIGELHIDGVPLTSDVRIGDVWVSAGVGAVYPKGISVAKQLPMPAPSSHFQILPVATTQDLDGVEEVFILTNYDQVGKEGDVDQ